MTHESSGARQANNIAAPEDALGRAVELLRAGEVVAIPTETVYGLAGNGLNPTALARIFEIKERPLYDPLILHFADASLAFQVVQQIPHSARLLAERFWPGPLTLVLPKRDLVPDLATSGLRKVAIRVPAHPIAQALLRAFGGCLAAPSANRFGRISPTDAAAVRAELGDRVPLILDGGPCTVGVESTVLDLSGEEMILLRAGGIAVEEIEFLVGPVQRAAPVEKSPVAPGQLLHHYAPRKPLRLVSTWEEVPPGRENGRLTFGPVADSDHTGQSVSPSGNLREAAANFFRILRSLDDDPLVSTIYAVLLPSESLGLAINERLERAACR